MIWIVGFLLVGIVFGHLVLGKIPTANHLNKSSGNKADSGFLPVSIIIPARNEEINLPNLLSSINHQSLRPFEVIVIDDHSTDKTALIARELGATLISAKPLPTGWTGKNWACYQGAQAATSEVLLFLDSDCVFETDGFLNIWLAFQGANQTHSSVISFLPFHKLLKPYEHLSLFFNLIMAAGAGKFGWLGKPCLFGQSLMISKKTYISFGGHESVKNFVLENVFMAKIITNHGHLLHNFSGKGVLSFRMFPEGLNQLIEGWTKAFASGAKAVPTSRLWASIIWLFALPTVTLILIFSLLYNFEFTRLLGIIYLSFCLQVFIYSRKLGLFNVLDALVFPLHWIFYQVIFFRSLFAAKNKKTWRGRTLG